MNGSPNSRVDCFPRVSPEQAIEWISQPPGPGGSMLKLLILGGAACVWDDADKALALGEYDAVMAVNDMIADWPGRLDYAVTLHPDKLPDWLRRRKQKGNPGRPQTWAHKGSGQKTPVDCQAQDWAGSSGLLGVRIGLMEGFGRIVLAGVPMEPTSAHYFDAKPWTDGKRYRSGWIAHKDEIAPYVRSMSGWTREFLGAPDPAWFDAD